jgi:hypothetical protein
MFTLPAIRRAIAAPLSLSRSLPSLITQQPTAYIGIYQQSRTLETLSHLHPSEGAGQTLQPPNTSSTAGDAVAAALGTSAPPVGASSESKAMGIEELRMKAKKLYKEVSRWLQVVSA